MPGNKSGAPEAQAAAAALEIWPTTATSEIRKSVKEHL